eukprot:GDKI01048918.1.p1 GENE.GDKI01048918.1~~GDKI01048918.1.p1  ORF type:complete len:241 (+),score=51.55 GDKI01048918.1:111-725(+)
MPINIPKIMKTLVEVHGDELLVDGCFNGDPHPGNILLLPDGRIGLIDYGQVKHINEEQRINLALFVVALAEGDQQWAAEILTDRIGLKSKHTDWDTLRRRAVLLFDADTKEMRGGLNVQAYFESLDKKDPVVYMPDDYVMPWRLSIMMRGMGYALRYPISTSTLWYPTALQVLQNARIDHKKLREEAEIARASRLNRRPVGHAE